MNKLYNIRLTNAECIRIKALESNNQLDYIRVILVETFDETCQIKQTFFRDTHIIPFIDINTELYKGNYVDNGELGIELNHYCLKGEIITMRMFRFEDE